MNYRNTVPTDTTKSKLLCFILNVNKTLDMSEFIKYYFSIKQVKSKFISQFQYDRKQYQNKKIHELLANCKSLYNSKFKEHLIIDDKSECLKKFYNREEIRNRMPSIQAYYHMNKKTFPNYCSTYLGKYMYENLKQKQYIIIRNTKNKESRTALLEDSNHSLSNFIDKNFSLSSQEIEIDSKALKKTDDHEFYKFYKKKLTTDLKIFSNNKAGELKKIEYLLDYLSDIIDKANKSNLHKLKEKIQEKSSIKYNIPKTNDFKKIKLPLLKLSPINLTCKDNSKHAITNINANWSKEGPLKPIPLIEGDPQNQVKNIVRRRINQTSIGFTGSCTNVNLHDHLPKKINQSRSIYTYSIFHSTNSSKSNVFNSFLLKRNIERNKIVKLRKITDKSKTTSVTRNKIRKSANTGSNCGNESFPMSRNKMNQIIDTVLTYKNSNRN